MAAPTRVKQVPKVVRQYRRARKLADQMTATWPDPELALHVAEAADTAAWHAVARHAGTTPPSADTAALAVELLREGVGS